MLVQHIKGVGQLLWGNGRFRKQLYLLHSLFHPHVTVANSVEEILLADKKLCVSISPSVLQVAQVGADNLQVDVKAIRKTTFHLRRLV